MDKKKFYSVICFGLFLIFLQGPVYSQSVKIDGEIRTRAEYRNGFQSPLADTLHSATKKQVNIDTKFPTWAYVMISFKPTFLSKK